MTLGQQAYEAYREVQERVHGLPYPDWEDLVAAELDGWQQAAESIVKNFDIKAYRDQLEGSNG